MAVVRAILFDCNGVIADDEPIHLQLFRKVLKEEGIPLTTKEYFERYLAMDDKSCFMDALARHKKPHTTKIVRSLVQRKARYYRDVIKNGIRIFPGVRAFVLKNRKKFVFAVVSGALRQEILWILKYAGLSRFFRAVVSAENVKRGKPNPECYKTGVHFLNRLPEFKAKPLLPRECVAIEDSFYGVEAAQKAGMKCVAVTNSYPRGKLKAADFVIPSLTQLLRHPPDFLARR